MDDNDIGAGSNVPASFNVAIEMPAFGEPVKYEAGPVSVQSISAWRETANLLT